MVSYKNILRNLTVVLLISIFAFSITPVAVLHRIFADHSDSVIHHYHTKNSEVAKAGIDCHFQSFVAERNFIAFCTRINFACFTIFPVFSQQYSPAFYSQHHFFAELRGPPVKA